MILDTKSEGVVLVTFSQFLCNTEYYSVIQTAHGWSHDRPPHGSTAEVSNLALPASPYGLIWGGVSEHTHTCRFHCIRYASYGGRCLSRVLGSRPFSQTSTAFPARLPFRSVQRSRVHCKLLCANFVLKITVITDLGACRLHAFLN